MNRRRQRLRLRRDWLVVQAELQREELARITAGLEVPLRIVDAGIAVGRALRIHRRMMALGGALRPGSRPRRLLRAGCQLLTGWQVRRIVWEHLRRIAPTRR